MQKYFRRPETKVSKAPYPSIGKALSGTKHETDDTKIKTILTSMIGRVIKETLEIDLNPNKFITVIIVIKTRITALTSILGKYIRTKLSENILIINPQIVRKYMQINTPKILLRNFPPVYSQISIKSLPRE